MWQPYFCSISCKLAPADGFPFNGRTHFLLCWWTMNPFLSSWKMILKYKKFIVSQQKNLKRFTILFFNPTLKLAASLPSTCHNNKRNFSDKIKASPNIKSYLSFIDVFLLTVTNNSNRNATIITTIWPLSTKVKYYMGCRSSSP